MSQVWHSFSVNIMNFSDAPWKLGKITDPILSQNEKKRISIMSLARYFDQVVVKLQEAELIPVW